MDWLKPKQEDVMVPCKKCSNKVPASSLKLDYDEKKMICPECIKGKKIHKEIEEELKKKHAPEPSKPLVQKPSIQNPVQPKPEAKVARMGHKCHSCGYKFMIDSETGKPKNCPYCNERVVSF